MFGYGRQGKYLLDLLLRTRKVKIGFVVEESQALRQAMVNDFRDIGVVAPPSYSLDEFQKSNESEKQDGFAVVTTTNAHVPIIKQLAPLKKPIFVEKPFASTYQESKEGWDVLDKYGTQCFVGFQRRLDKYMKGIYDKTRGKEIKAVRAYHCDNPTASLDYLSKAGP